MHQSQLLAVLLASCVRLGLGAVEYYGKYLGPLKQYHHGVGGEVYIVDARTLHIRDFTYDGEGPAAYFYAGNSKAPGSDGFRLRDEKGSPTPLKRYRKRHVTLSLPDGKSLNDIKWFYVWCEEFSVNFGDVKIPRNGDWPKPQKIAALAGVHAVSSEPIVVVDAQTLLVPSFSYDGEAPDAKFWVGQGPKPSPQGVRVPDENGKQVPLRRYDRKTIVLTLPGDLTVFDIGHFGVWCEAFTVDFGHIQIPARLNVPPSLRMLGVSPQSKLNCEVLDEALAFEVRWAVAGDSVVLQLVAKLEAGEYMSFGLSGNEENNLMIGGDVVVAWLDQETLGGFIQDYFLDAKSQCAGDRGTCPDYRIQPNSESVRLLNAAHVNGYSIVTYQRPLRAHDGLDIPIYTNKSQAVIWAVGPLNSKQEASYHSVKSTSDVLLHFGRSPKWNCPIPATDAAIAMSGNSEATVSEEVEREGEEPQTQENVTAYKTPPTPAPAPSDNAWEIPAIQCHEPEDGVFYAQMGPTGGKHGYPAITGHVGWGISYYINGLLIPEINVVRGHTYTFVVEGGQDPETPAKYHPFYITDDPIGGYMHKTPQEKAKSQLFAGVEYTKSGDAVPVGLGRLCNWTPDPDQPLADEFASFGAYQRTLTLICDHGEPGVIQWTPDQDTPDTVYYQCFVHRYLGWKINVLDSCDTSSASASSPIPSRLKPDGKSEPTRDTMEMDELQGRPSIRVVTRVKPLFSQSIEGNKGNYREYQNSLPQTSSNLYSQEIQDFTYTTNDNQQHTKPEIFIPPKSSPKFPELPTKYSAQSYYTIPEQENIEEFKVEMNSSNEAATKTSFENVKVDISKPARLPMQENYNGVRVDYTRIPPSRRPASIVSHLRPRPLHAMMMHSGPKQGMMMRRPVQSGATRHPVIVKKPVFRLQPRPMLIAHSTPQKSILVPDRIPIPQRSVSLLFSKKKKTNTVDRVKDEVKMPLAVNTGFNPGSLVIESGFKPITPQSVVAEDRISEVDEHFYDNLEAMEEYQPGTVDFQQTEWFEPMFIPSPPDQNEQKHKKPFGNGHKKLQKPNQQNRRMVRPIGIRPDNANLTDVYVQLQQEDQMIAAESLNTYYLTPSDTVHSVSKTVKVVNPVKSDTDMRTILTYDGKPVLNSKLVLPVPSKPIKSKLRTSDFIRNIPQFGPFRGDAPPPIPGNIQPESIPQLRLNDKTQPLHSLSLQLEPTVQNILAGRQRTQLSLVQHIQELSSSIDTLQPEATYITDIRYKEDITDPLKPAAPESKDDLKTSRSEKPDPGSLVNNEQTSQ